MNDDTVRFLEVYEVIHINLDQIERYGGVHGIRDQNLLDSSVNTARASYGNQFLHKTIFDKASAYIFHISQNHPFLDGNKRTALAAGLVFLDINGIDIKDVDDTLYNLMIQVSNGLLDKIQISKILKSLSH
jgi:death-on-curing protein